MAVGFRSFDPSCEGGLACKPLKTSVVTDAEVA